MFGVLTDDADLARAGVAESYYLVDQVDGSRQEPLADAINAVACWGDTQAVREDPDRAAVAADGTRAVPETPGHHWGTVCPTDPDYRACLLERLEEVGAVGDVRLTTPGFPAAEFCHCERCTRRFEASEHADRTAWRTDVVTRFVADAADRIDGEVTVTLYPDPYPGHLRERAGIDPGALASHVDEFLVPLCATDYESSYWVGSLACGFASELEDLEASLAVQLSTLETDTERLTTLSRQLRPHVDTIVYGTSRDDLEVVKEAIRRIRSGEESDSDAAAVDETAVPS